MNEIFNNLNDAIKRIFELSSLYAKDGVKNNIGGPFGAGIIQKIDNKYKILTISRNTVIESNDPTSHAEVNAIRSACKILNNKSLDDCILVTTAKSCPMCLSASIWANIKTIYYSEDYEDAITAGFRDNDIAEYIKGNNNIIKEEQIKDDNCILPFIDWNNKSDRINY